MVRQAAVLGVVLAALALGAPAAASPASTPYSAGDPRGDVAVRRADITHFRIDHDHPSIDLTVWVRQRLTADDPRLVSIVWRIYPVSPNLDDRGWIARYVPSGRHQQLSLLEPGSPGGSSDCVPSLDHQGGRFRLRFHDSCMDPETIRANVRATFDPSGPAGPVADRAPDVGLTPSIAIHPP